MSGGSQIAAPAGVVVWLTGLPSSGKSTLARTARELLAAEGRPCCVLDGDEVRGALVPAPGYDSDGRQAFYRTLSHLAALLARQGLVVLVAATAHARILRAYARSAAPRFVEVFVDTPREECQRRDAKGLYRVARGGAASELPGASVPYEPPLSADLVARGGATPEAARAILELVSRAPSAADVSDSPQEDR